MSVAAPPFASNETDASHSTDSVASSPSYSHHVNGEPWTSVARMDFAGPSASTSETSQSCQSSTFAASGANAGAPQTTRLFAFISVPSSIQELGKATLMPSAEARTSAG